MKFAKITFLVAAIWGLLELTPLYFMFNVIGRQDPPAITHPAFYYGFLGVALSWQVGFLIIAADPVRLRPIIPAAILEKFTYTATLIVLYAQGRLHASDLPFGVVDLLLGTLFVMAWGKIRTSS